MSYCRIFSVLFINVMDSKGIIIEQDVCRCHKLTIKKKLCKQMGFVCFNETVKNVFSLIQRSTLTIKCACFVKHLHGRHDDNIRSDVSKES